MPLAASYHLAALIVVPVFGALVLCFLSWRDKAIKLNVEIEADALFAPESGVNGRSHQGSAFPWSNRFHVLVSAVNGQDLWAKASE